MQRKELVHMEVRKLVLAVGMEEVHNVVGMEVHTLARVVVRTLARVVVDMLACMAVGTQVGTMGEDKQVCKLVVGKLVCTVAGKLVCMLEGKWVCKVVHILALHHSTGYQSNQPK